MGKRLFLIIASMIAAVLTPGTLMAADDVAAGEPGFGNAVETVILPEEPEVVEESVYAPVIEVAEAAPVPQVVNYTVTRYVATEDEYVSLASSLSYSDIYKFQKLVYAHNSSALLGNLAYRSEGELITITEGAELRTYRIAAIALYERTADGNLNGDASLMRNIAYGALGHDVAMMTCAGTPDGRGGASHRLVIFADAV